MRSIWPSCVRAPGRGTHGAADTRGSSRPHRDQSAGANLVAFLSGANLAGANLTRTNLSNAALDAADLSNADLSGANLSRANLHNAILTGVQI